MKIKILKFLEGAKMATGTAVLFDVFRASNTILACLKSGAAFVIPVGDLQEAYQLKEKYPAYLLFGERGGIPPEGFDSDNSPAKAIQLDLKGRKVILTTSAGSQGIVNAGQVEELLIGSFANIETIVAYIKTKNPEEVSLIAIGENALIPAVEDEACAAYLKKRLEGEAALYAPMLNSILKGRGARRLRQLDQEEDLDFCTQLNFLNLLPVYNKLSNRIELVSEPR